MQTSISIQGASFFAYHGYYEEERKSGNNFIIDAGVTVKTFDSLDDNILDTVNYETLYTICKEEMSQTQKLLETVVYNILIRFRDQLPHVSDAWVTMHKIGPQLGGKVDRAVVSMRL